MIEKLRSAIDEQVRTIDSCLKLHGHLCPPDFIRFHETLEKFFKKNFRDEIRRLAVDGSDSITVSTSSRSHNMTVTTSYPSSSYEQSMKRSISSFSTARFGIPPIQVGRLTMTPPLESPISDASALSVAGTLVPRCAFATASWQDTELSSAPGDLIGGSDSLSAESPHDSFVNVGNGIHGTAQMSGASVATSYMGSMGSFGSLKGRFSRFGSLNFSRNKAS